jgi:ubiquinone/menaquinone biosynthesis C-methylase UbiE
MKAFYRIFVLALILHYSYSTVAQGQREGINDNYLAPDLQVAVWAERFEVEGREVFDLRNDIMTSIGLLKGQAVADVGAGTGLFTPLLADLVGSTGKVYAVDIVPKFIDHIDQKINDKGLSQVETVLSSERSIELPANSVDMVFSSDAYHHFVFYEDMLSSMHKALKPGGVLIIVEFDIERDGTPEQRKDHVGGTKGEFTAQIKDNGFAFVADLTLDDMRETFIRRFRKK